MPNHRTHLKIKIKELSAEARIIRAEEQKWRVTQPKRIKYTDHRGVERVKVVREPKPHVTKMRAAFTASGKAADENWAEYMRLIDHPMRDSLYWHRIGVVRPTLRTCMLAYGFLRGRSYAEMESTPRWREAHKNEAALIRPDTDAIWNEVQKFRGFTDYRVLAQKFEQWVQEAGLPARTEEVREGYSKTEPTVAVVGFPELGSDVAYVPRRGFIAAIKDLFTAW